MQAALYGTHTRSDMPLFLRTGFQHSLALAFVLLAALEVDSTTNTKDSFSKEVRE